MTVLKSFIKLKFVHKVNWFDRYNVSIKEIYKKNFNCMIAANFLDAISNKYATKYFANEKILI